MQKNLQFLWLFLSALAYGQQNTPSSWVLSAAVSAEIQKDSLVSEKVSTWIELQEERTLFSKFYQSKQGHTRQIFSSVPLHYLSPAGQLLPYELSYERHADHIVFNRQEHPMMLFDDGSFGLEMSANEVIKIGKQTKLNGILIQKNCGDLGVITPIKFQNLPIEQQLELSNGKIGFHYRISEALALNNSDFTIEEQLSLPKGWQIVNPKDNIEPYLFIQDMNGNKRALLTHVLCYDANGHTIASQIEIEENLLRIRIPHDWIQNPERVYPITIDPLIGGIPSVWSGGQMPSCFMPAYNEDSIQVTIPAGITPTGVYVDASFYANPFTFSTMSQGSMYFSTSCGVSQSFTVTGATAGTAGTAYLDSFNLMNPLVCCLQKSCNPIQFWVSMHLGRNANGSGCNTNYILYDPFTTSWPFKVVVYGRSPESYGNEWYTSQTPICSNKCQVNATAYARYGVAPFTFSHPWTSTIGTAGQNLGCNSGASNFVFTLTVPNCPIYCDSSYTNLSIPPPIIVDACGTFITGLLPANKPLIAAIEPNLTYDSLICNGAPIQILNPPCISDGVTQFIDGAIQGFGDFNTSVGNLSDTMLTQTYYFFAERMGCKSDTVAANITIVPNPIAGISIVPNPLIVGTTGIVGSSSSSTVSTSFWNQWSNLDSVWQSNSDFEVSYEQPGAYLYCLNISDEFGCSDSICEVLNVVPATIENINIVTPNNDGTNDFLSFQYLDFYPNASIQILNRWGQLIFESGDYQNNWNGADYTEGTYFYKLYIPGLNKTLQSFFVLEK